MLVGLLSTFATTILGESLASNAEERIKMCISKQSTMSS